MFRRGNSTLLIQRIDTACQEPQKTKWFAHCHVLCLLLWFNSDHVKLQQPIHQLCILGISVNSAGKSQIIPHLRAETVSFQMAACMWVFVFSYLIEPLLLCSVGDAVFFYCTVDIPIYITRLWIIFYIWHLEFSTLRWDEETIQWIFNFFIFFYIREVL